MTDLTRPTIFALSSGRPPAAIAVVRVSGPRTQEALRKLIGKVPAPRQAALARIRDAIFQGSAERMFAQLVSDRELSREELERMRRLLAERLKEKP